MATPDLVVYVRQQSQAGVPAQELRETLMSAGWSERDIENALHDVAAGLRPVTAGASIHEDLAQVRGLVAHLAARVGRLETRLVASGDTAMLTEPEELPSGAMRPERALPMPRRGAWGIIVGTLIVLAVSVGAGSYFASLTSATAPRALMGSGIIAFVLALLSWYFVRYRRPWPARLSAATAVVLAGWSAWLAWNSYALVELQTALAIAALVAVYLFVIARWIGQAER